MRSCIKLAVAAVIGMALGGVWSALRPPDAEWAGVFDRRPSVFHIALGAILGTISALVLLSVWSLGNATPRWHRMVSIVILALFACAALFTLVIELGRDPVQLGNFRRIKVGMDMHDVATILGPPEDFTHGTKLYQNGAREEADGKLRVIWDVGGNVAFDSSSSLQLHPGGTGWFGSEGAIIVYWDDAGNATKKEFYVPFEGTEPTPWQRIRALFPW